MLWVLVVPQGLQPRGRRDSQHLMRLRGICQRSSSRIQQPIESSRRKGRRVSSSAISPSRSQRPLLADSRSRPTAASEQQKFTTFLPAAKVNGSILLMVTRRSSAASTVGLHLGGAVTFVHAIHRRGDRPSFSSGSADIGHLLLSSRTILCGFTLWRLEWVDGLGWNTHEARVASLQA
jgi:hypothetical protein